MQKNALKKGFTLIELLIVITIIGILAAALLPSVLGAPARARDAARKADLQNIIAAIETYNSDNQEYPQLGGCIDDADVDIADYFTGGNIPADPQEKTPSTDLCADDYAYCATDTARTNYFIATFVEIPGDGNAKAADAGFADCTAGPVAAPTIPAAVPADADVYIIQK